MTGVAGTRMRSWSTVAPTCRLQRASAITSWRRRSRAARTLPWAGSWAAPWSGTRAPWGKDGGGGSPSSPGGATTWAPPPTSTCSTIRGSTTGCAASWRAERLIEVERIARARAAIDPVFKDTPQFVSEPLSELLGLRLLVKVESVNPIRSFKGRGADWFLQTLESEGDLVCASAGNFGAALACAARGRGRRLTVFAATTANQLKIARMRALGAEVRLEGKDFDAAKDAARRHAEGIGAVFVEDGAVDAIAEGAGTIAAELTDWPEPVDAVVVPVGNGALINGIAAWLRARSPATRVIGVCPEGGPSMSPSRLEGRAVS